MSESHFIPLAVVEQCHGQGDIDPVSYRVGEEYSPKSRAWRIGKRDGWICRICQLPIDPEYWRARLGLPFESLRVHLKPEADHIIQKDWGGSDEDENLQIAHAACNRHKHIDPQLPVGAAGRYLEWRLGLAVEKEIDRPLWRPPGGSQRAALEAAVERDELAGKALFLFGKSMLLEDHERASRLLCLAAEHGDAGNVLLLGLNLHQRARHTLHRREFGEASQWYRRAVNLCHIGAPFVDRTRCSPRAMVELGVILAADLPEEAAELFQRAADKGNLIGTSLLTRDQEQDQANRLLWVAAERGEWREMIRLGLLFADNAQFAQQSGDDDKAHQLHCCAVDLCHIGATFIDAAHYRSAQMMRIGLILRAEHPQQAAELFQRAADEGDLSVVS